MVRIVITPITFHMVAVLGSGWFMGWILLLNYHIHLGGLEIKSSLISLTKIVLPNPNQLNKETIKHITTPPQVLSLYLSLNFFICHQVKKNPEK